MTPVPSTAPPAHFDTKQAARILGLPAGRLRQCVRAGLVVPQRDARGRLQFDFVDLVLLRTTSGLLKQRVPLKKIGHVLASLRRQIGDRPLTRLSVYADGKRVVAWDGASRWQPDSGQFLLNFAADGLLKRAASVAKLPSSKSTRALPKLSADQWCDLAMEIEESSPLEARAAYHHAIDLDPGSIVARINLGRLLHTEGNLVGAEAHFREAVRYDPTCALAWYNLGVVLEDLERPDDATPCYEHAVHSDAEFADAHWNLSLLYEKGGRHQDALRHLALYRKLTAKRR